MAADESGDTVRACPECDRAGGVTPRQGWSHRQEGDERYRCAHCGARFPEPTIRESRGTSGFTDHSYVAKLQEIDPDDLGGEPV